MDTKMQEIMNLDQKALDERLETIKNQHSFVQLTAVYDKRAKKYDRIMTTPSLVFAARGFTDACRDENSPMYNYPEDFELHHIGTMDQDTGKIFQRETPEVISQAKFLVVKKNETK